MTKSVRGNVAAGANGCSHFAKGLQASPRDLTKFKQLRRTMLPILHGFAGGDCNEGAFLPDPVLVPGANGCSHCGMKLASVSETSRGVQQLHRTTLPVPHEIVSGDANEGAFLPDPVLVTRANRCSYLHQAFHFPSAFTRYNLRIPFEANDGHSHQITYRRVANDIRWKRRAGSS